MSSLEEKIATQYLEAYKAHNNVVVSVLRLLKSALANAQIAQSKELSDEDVITVIRKEAKKRQEAIELYTQAGDSEKVSSEKAEYDILNAYLPTQMSEEEITPIVLQAIAHTGASKDSDFGKVMGICMGELTGKADASMVSACVKKHLGK